jgi:alkaline phosphatase
MQSDRGLRASWEDANTNNKIDSGEEVYWAWNSANHTNSLVRLFVEGAGENEFFHYATGVDPVRGFYLDNTDIFKVMHSALHGFSPADIQKYYTPLFVSY